MTELEQQLLNALTALSQQYEEAMKAHDDRIADLQRQMLQLEEAVTPLQAQAEALQRQVALLREDYQADRRRVERGLNVIWQRARTRQRGMERDSGPSR